MPLIFLVHTLAEVFKKLYPIKEKWYNIGLELGVDNIKLKDIERGDNEEGKALRRMLEEALKNKEAITWRHICDTLRNPTVGDSVLAQQLELEQIKDKDGKQQAALLDITGVYFVCSYMAVVKINDYSTNRSYINSLSGIQFSKV